MPVRSCALPEVPPNRPLQRGAHREAAAQYGRVLRFGDRLSVGERAELYERRSRECYLTDQSDEAIEAAEKAVACRRELGDKVREGGSLRWLSEVLWCPGRAVESEQVARQAVALLEPLPPGPRAGHGVREARLGLHLRRGYDRSERVGQPPARAGPTPGRHRGHPPCARRAGQVPVR